MKNKTSKKLNLMFSNIYKKTVHYLEKNNKLDRAVYLLSIAAREVYNVFFTYTEGDTNKLFFHKFATSLEIMNRYDDTLRGIFLGDFHKTCKSDRVNESYVKIYALVEYTNYPNSIEREYFQIPFRDNLMHLL